MTRLKDVRFRQKGAYFAERSGPHHADLRAQFTSTFVPTVAWNSAILFTNIAEGMPPPPHRETMSIFEKEHNNFSIVRLFAALTVVYSHSYTICRRPGYSEFVAKYSGVTHAGEIAVAIFFFLSGALVTKSLMSSKTNFSFFAKRILRIYPALIFSVLINVLIIVPIFGGINLIRLMAEHQTYVYILHNVLSVWNEHFIPGVYETHPSKALNGSLWSLTLEVRLYLVWGICGLLGLAKTREAAISCCLIGLAVGLTHVDSLPLLGNNKSIYGNYDFPRFSLLYMLGGLSFLINIPKDSLLPGVIISALFLYISTETPLLLESILLLSITTSLYIGTLPVLLRIKLPGDYSFGVYLFGWPSQQVAYSLMPDAVPLANAALAGIIALGLAALSWHLVESPSIALAKTMSDWTSLFRWQRRALLRPSVPQPAPQNPNRPDQSHLGCTQSVVTNTLPEMECPNRGSADA